MRSLIVAWRCRRRGTNLTETVLMLVVLGALFSAGSRVVAGYMDRQAVQRTAGQLSRLADDVGEWVEVDFLALRPRVAATVSRVEELGWAEMIADGSVSQPGIPTTPLRQSVRVFLHAPTNRDLFVVLLTDSSTDGIVRSVPRPDSYAQLVGRVDVHAPEELRGWEFTYDLRDIIAADGDGFRGELRAVRHVSDELHVSPYLHRFAVPGRPELNRLEAALEMNGHAVTGIASLEAEQVSLSGDLAVVGTLEAGKLGVNGDLSVNGVLTAERLEASEIDAATVYADIVTADSAVIETATAASLVVSGPADVTTLMVDHELSVDSLVLGDVTMGHAVINGSLTAPTIIADTLATNSCTGC